MTRCPRCGVPIQPGTGYCGLCRVRVGGSRAMNTRPRKERIRDTSGTGSAEAWSYARGDGNRDLCVEVHSFDGAWVGTFILRIGGGPVP